MQFSNDCSILGLKLKRTGTVSHIGKRIRLAKTQTQKLKRYNNLEESTKLHLYKALVRPILEYPEIPNALASRSQLKKMQGAQNRNRKMVAKNTDNENKTIKQLHETYGIDAINIRLYNAADKLWNNFSEKGPEIQNRSRIENQNNIKDCQWWPRSVKKVAVNVL